MIELTQYPATVLSAGHFEPFLFEGEYVVFEKSTGDTGFLTLTCRRNCEGYEWLHVRLKEDKIDHRYCKAVMSRKELMMLIAEKKYVVA
jgi:hypothetical protein